MAMATTMVTTMDIPTQSMRLAMKPAPIPVSQLMKRYVSITRSPWLASYLPKQHIHHKHSLNGKPKPKGNFDLALMGVFIHIMGDCANNLGVIIAGLVIWLADYHGRYYADPAVSMAIAVMIFVSSLPLIKRSGLILLQSAPDGVEHEDVKHDLLQIPGIRAVHELHIWRLNQKKSLASAHIVLEDDRAADFPALARTVKECFHAYGIHSVTLQPEMPVVPKGAVPVIPGSGLITAGDSESHDQGDKNAGEQCHLLCGKMCTDLSCCE
jgi:zinc transporter 1